MKQRFREALSILDQDQNQSNSEQEACKLIRLHCEEDPILFFLGTDENEDFVCLCLECGKAITISKTDDTRRRIISSDLNISIILGTYNELRTQYGDSVDYDILFHDLMEVIITKTQKTNEKTDSTSKVYRVIRKKD